MEQKTIAIIGLGLIGGSMAKALKQKTPHMVLGMDKDPEVCRKALQDGAVDEIITTEQLERADVVLLALFPRIVLELGEEVSSHMHPGAILTDLCGVKGCICGPLDQLAQRHNIHFVGGHPMAGREFPGYDASLPTLYEGGSMILTPMSTSTPEVLDFLQEFFLSLGFAQVVRTTPENHDKMIAFTSQLAHVVSSAYIKSPTVKEESGFSAGSFRDLTRVAKLNEDMWTELFLMNQPALLYEIDTIMAALAEYRDALADGDGERMRSLLRDGRILKEWSLQHSITE